MQRTLWTPCRCVKSDKEQMYIRGYVRIVVVCMFEFTYVVCEGRFCFERKNRAQLSFDKYF